MKRIVRLISVALCLWLLQLGAVSFAAVPTDFSFKGLCLGDSVEQMKEKLGEPDFDTEMYYRGVPVIRYTYSAEQRIFVSAADKRVVEMFCKSKHYVGPHGVTYGATRAGLMDVFGQAEHKNINGSVCYVYTNPANKKEKMVLELETEKYYLLSWTFTSLSLDEDEGAILITGQEAEASKPKKKFNYGGLPEE